MLEKLADSKTWNRFLSYKTSVAMSDKAEKQLRRFIDEKAYSPIVDNILSGSDFPLPHKAIISKASTQKKRTLYIYPKAESTVLKLLTYLLLRKYDHIFSTGLYSFRPGRNAKTAFVGLSSRRDIGKMYSYKVDVSNYFNSINVDGMKRMLEETIDDPELLAFLLKLLLNPNVVFEKKIIQEDKGIMAGTPLASFYANLYLKDLDYLFTDRCIPYARYSDDIIVFAETEEKIREYADEIKGFLKNKALDVNPSKEEFTKPGERWVFLGYSYQDGKIDISPVSLKKLKAKMRRKSRALVRWSNRKGIDREQAAKAFIKIFNSKLFEYSEDNELSWCHWFFPVINTDESLHELDRYAQDCIRYIATGTRTKSRYNFRYDEMKKLGYRSTLNYYYSFREKDGAEQ